MPSYPRYLIIHDGSTFHLTWQCINFSFFLKDDWAKKLYYDLLLEWKDAYGVSIYAYNLMDNHPHLAGKTVRKEGISDLMRRINCKFAKEYNKRNKRRGQVVMDRFKSPNIQTDEYLLNVMTYLDLNPVRAKKIKHPRQYKWTSYHYYAYGKKDPLITPAPSYLGLADTDKDRQRIYREMVDILIEEGLRKEDYSVVHFIGDPDWVRSNQKGLTEWFRDRYLEWKERTPINYWVTDDYLPEPAPAR